MKNISILNKEKCIELTFYMSSFFNLDIKTNLKYNFFSDGRAD